MLSDEEIQERIAAGRKFMHMWEEDPDYQTDQQQKKKQPPLTKAPVSEERISLPVNYTDLPMDTDFLHVINSRASHRVYTQEPMSLLELSCLLWCTQGVKEIRGRAYATLRTVPCGGARHQFETYLAVQNVEGLKKGLYHYLPMTHQLELLQEQGDLKEMIGSSLCGQVWAAKANVVFYYSCVAYRCEWRYGIYAHRVALIDAGHITENLYLTATALGLGGCAIGAIDEKICDPAFGLDGEEEFIFYAMPVGKISAEDKGKEADFYAFVKEQNL